MSTTVQATFNHGEAFDLPQAVRILLKTNGGEWEGTAAELITALNSNLSPRALSTKLHRYEMITALSGLGVSLTFRRSHGKKLITLQETAPSAPQIITNPAVSKDTGVAKRIALSEIGVAFPFAWSYGTVEELSAVERQALARRSCSLCGAHGSVTHSKRCEGYPRTLLCRECARDYVVKATKLLRSGVIAPMNMSRNSS